MGFLARRIPANIWMATAGIPQRLPFNGIYCCYRRIFRNRPIALGRQLANEILDEIMGWLPGAVYRYAWQANRYILVLAHHDRTNICFFASEYQRQGPCRNDAEPAAQHKEGARILSFNAPLRGQIVLWLCFVGTNNPDDKLRHQVNRNGRNASLTRVPPCRTAEREGNRGNQPPCPLDCSHRPRGVSGPL